jgi:hypothetical protein
MKEKICKNCMFIRRDVKAEKFWCVALKGMKGEKEYVRHISVCPEWKCSNHRFIER